MKRILILVSPLVLLIAIVVTIVVIVRGSNDPPVAENISITTQEDTPVSIMLAGIDSDGDPLSYNLLTEPSHGSLSSTGAEMIYTPDKDFNGSDKFTYKVSDGFKESPSADVSIEVTSVNDPPTADDDYINTREDAPVVMIDVLTNDRDVDGDKIILLGVKQGQNGSVTISTNNKLTYTAKENFSGGDSFEYTISDGKGGTDTATVELTIESINDPPVIISKPVTITRTWASYRYDVNAKDPDLDDTLVYSLTKKPEGMTIDPNTGLIEWRPNNNQHGDYDVAVKVIDANQVPSSDAQLFTITVASLSSPLITPLTVEDGSNIKNNKKLSEEARLDNVLSSDNKYIEIEADSYMFFDFSDASIPEGAKIVSVTVFVEHFEDRQFPLGKVKWSIGTDWPDNPISWASIKASVRDGQRNKATDSWDITSLINTPERVDSLQFQIENNSNIANRKTRLDYIYITVRWY